MDVFDRLMTSESLAWFKIQILASAHRSAFIQDFGVKSIISRTALIVACKYFCLNWRTVGPTRRWRPLLRLLGLERVLQHDDVEWLPGLFVVNLKVAFVDKDTEWPLSFIQSMRLNS